MPGGHCPIVRPHHRHTKKNLPRVGDPPFIAAAWCGAHTKQARAKEPRRKHRIETVNGFDPMFSSWYFSLASRRCVRPRVRVHVHVRAHTHTYARRDQNKKNNPVNSYLYASRIGYFVYWVVFLVLVLLAWCALRTPQLDERRASDPR